jgi:prepilin peptidase CpaA
LCFFAAYAVCFAGGIHNQIFSPILAHLMSAGIVFVFTFLVFAFRLMGAADSKLATAFAFWLGLEGMVTFLFFWSLAGGVLAIMAYLLKNWEGWPKMPEDYDVATRRSANKNAIPYGIAISVGAMIAFLDSGYFMAFVQLH